jgi:hypothetical protein
VNKAAIPIVARLAALQTASDVAPDGARVIATVSDANPLVALLREVNETILGRSLRFESSGGASMTLEVAGRRVLRLAEVSGLAGAESCLAAETLEDEHKDALIKLMEGVAAPRKELRVTSFATGQVLGGVSVGLPVALLADLLLVDLNPVPGAAPPEPEEKGDPPALSLARRLVVAPGADEPATGGSVATRDLAALARSMGPVLTAWLVRGGSDDGVTEGPEEMVSHLYGFLEDEAEAVLAQLDLVSNQPGSAVCAVLGATLVEGHGVLCARSGNGLLLGVVEGDATQALLAAWAKARL